MNSISKENIIIELRAFIQENILDQPDLLDENQPFNNLGIDSFSIIQIVLFIERKYKVAMTEKDLTPANLASISSLADFTLNHL